MSSPLKRELSLLLAVLLLAALLGGCAGGGDKPPAQVTPVPKTSTVPSPAPAVTPDAPVPVKPGDPEPSPESSPVTLASLVGVWELYSTEVEGDFHLAADTDGRSWLVVRDCARADLVEMRDGFETVEQLNCPITEEPGGLFLNLPEDEYGRECLVARVSEDELELSFSFQYPDSTPGGSTQIFRRLQDPGADFNGTALSARELRALNDRVNTVEENGFFQCTFSRPQQIDWHEVLYNGAGIECEPSEEALEEFNRYMDEDWDCPIICIADTAVRDFVWEKTLTSYAEAENQLWTTWTEADGYALTSHGDTNFMPIELTGAEADGDIYRLYYERSDFANRVWAPVPFVMTLRIRDGQWQYISNLRADVPRATLLTVDYFQEKTDIPDSMDIIEFVDTPEMPYDEPSWVWAVLTAQEDGVRYCVDRADRDIEDSDYYLTMFLDRYIGENVTSGVLDKGERVAVKVNLPWYPTMRLMATKDTLYGELWVGENGMLHIFDNAARRWVDGSDADAEGRGCYPLNEDELISFLCDGDWFWIDPVTEEPRAVLRIPYGHDCFIESSETYFEFTFDYLYGDGEVPDRISIRRGYSDYIDWSFLPARLLEGDSCGTYYWTAYQLDGEQILYLTQADDEPGVLRYLPPPSLQDSDTEFLFVRFKGTFPEEGQG